MRNDPTWAAMEEVAHTLASDSTVIGDAMASIRFAIKRRASVTIPMLVMDGGESPARL